MTSYHTLVQSAAETMKAKTTKTREKPQIVFHHDSYFNADNKTTIKIKYSFKLQIKKIYTYI